MWGSGFGMIDLFFTPKVYNFCLNLYKLHNYVMFNKLETIFKLCKYNKLFLRTAYLFPAKFVYVYVLFLGSQKYKLQGESFSV